MPFIAGHRLGPYEIVSPIGAGGMGEVHRARDPRLGREVAIKVVSGAGGDSGRLRRFEQEARAVAALSQQSYRRSRFTGARLRSLVVSMTRLRIIAVVILLTAILNGFLLRAPAPPAGTEAAHCVQVVPLGYGFRYILNCDSQEFLTLARKPWLVLQTDEHRLWQSRPAFPALAYLVAWPLRWMRTDSTPESPNYALFAAREPEFAAYALINVAAISIALLCFYRMLKMGGSDVGPEVILPFVLVAANDLTKAFFWTAHLQMFNILTPCLTLYLNVRLLSRTHPLTPIESAGVGLALGAGILAYGAFIVPVASLAAISVLFHHRILAPAVLFASALLPYAVWYAFIRAHTGSFYSHEIVAYRQFVWLADCVKAEGITGCVPRLQVAWRGFADSVKRTTTVPLALASGAVMLRYVAARRTAAPTAEAGSDGIAGSGVILRAAMFQVGTAAVFLFFMGYYNDRLTWALVPGMLIVFTSEMRIVRRAHPVSSWWLLLTTSSVAAIAYVIRLLTHPGPYS